MNWLQRFTGGRPMKFVCETFRDVVSGEMVNYYIDQRGRHWLASGRWSLFRIPPRHGPDIWEQPK